MFDDRLKAAALCVAILSLFGGAARAEDDGGVCPDRPAKAYANCVVPAGRFQIESDVYDQSWMSTHDQKQTVTFYTNPTFKYGVAEGIDVEAAITPWLTTRTRDRLTGESTTQRGPSDLTLEAKFAVTKEVTLMPFVTAPTAMGGQGAGGWGGGLRAPMQFDLPAKGWTFTLSPELDAVHNEAGGGAHLAHVEVIGVNTDVGHGVNLGAEVWGQWDYDPSGHTTQASFDLTIAWVPPRMKTVQFDAQVNFGATRATPDTQLIFGVAKRF